MIVQDIADIIGSILVIAIAAKILGNIGGVNKTAADINTVGSMFTGALKTIQGG